jgi:hypothetical protein
MVTVSDFKETTTKDGKTFVSLVLTGRLELVQSSNTGKFYGTIRSTRIPTTFTSLVAKNLIGTQMPGEIVRVTVEPYQFISPTTGEVMTLQHSYSYQPPNSNQLIGETQVLELA